MHKASKDQKALIKALAATTSKCFSSVPSQVTLQHLQYNCPFPHYYCQYYSNTTANAANFTNHFPNSGRPCLLNTFNNTA
eukprot:1161856-Pelagomonas_calceolata.AAC.2